MPHRKETGPAELLPQIQQTLQTASETQTACWRSGHYSCEIWGEASRGKRAQHIWGPWQELFVSPHVIKGICGCLVCDYFLITQEWAKGTDVYETAEAAGDVNPDKEFYETKEAKDIWQTAQEETGWDAEQIDQLRKIPTDHETARWQEEPARRTNQADWKRS